MEHPLDAHSHDAKWPLQWAAALAFFVFLQCCIMAYTTPLGIPPDELAHLSYVRDVADGGLLPDYANGRIGSSQQANYLAHPPLYYSVLGTLSRARGMDPFDDYRMLRLVSALFVGLGFLLWLLSARNIGVGLRGAMLVSLGACATPMFAYAAGSINNDTLLFLGVGLFFFGATREYVQQRRDRRSGLAMIVGLAVTFLTKATGSAFIVFFIAACLLPQYRQLFALLRNRRHLAILAATCVICGAYFLYSLVRFGALMPTPGTLYAESAPAHAMVPIEFAWRYAVAMWERLPIIMSHANIQPFVSPKGIVLFYAMLLVPVLGWLVARPGARSRGVDPIVIRATDAFAIAFAVTLVLHIAITYRGYLHNGLLAGMQPRYFAFLLPALWFPAFVLERRPIPRALITGTFFVCAAVSFWASVPFVVAKQSGPTHAGNATATARRPTSQLKPAIASAVQGHLDEFRLSGDRLKLRGWAFDTRGSEAVRRILVLRGDRRLTSVPSDQARPDVAKALAEPDALKSGFDTEVRGIPDGTRPCEIEIAGEAHDGVLVWLRRGTCHP